MVLKLKKKDLVCPVQMTVKIIADFVLCGAEFKSHQHNKDRIAPKLFCESVQVRKVGITVYLYRAPRDSSVLVLSAIKLSIINIYTANV